MFHPDNIKNYTLDGVPVSIALHHYWTIIGGPQGLAKNLRSHTKVSTSPPITTISSYSSDLPSSLFRTVSREARRTYRRDLKGKDVFIFAVSDYIRSRQIERDISYHLIIEP
jgi:hypothetical protein